MNTVEQKSEYITKTELREVVTEIVNTAVEEIGRIMAIGFAGVDARFERVEKRLDVLEEEVNIRATKSDILNLHDKFVPYNRFDELALRVYKLENNNA